MRRRVPPGIAVARSIRGRKDFSFHSYRSLVLIVTFIAYAGYHASRKPPSIVKSVLDPEPGTAVLHHTASNTSISWPWSLIFVPYGGGGPLSLSSTSAAAVAAAPAGWSPFNGPDGKARLGQIDVAFLACYAFGMFFAGHLGDRLDLRHFLTLGMLGSGAFVCLFGMGYWWKLHSLSYFLVVQMLAGLFQATGWPSVVAIVGNWCNKSDRGLVMGIWNAHTSVGNIAGSLLASSVLAAGWGWSFLLPGLFIMVGGILVYLFLVVHPDDLQVPADEADDQQVSNESSSSSMDLGSDSDLEAGVQVVVTDHHQAAVGFFEAWMIPGVAPFAFSLFFAKLVAYTFLYWLPFYIRHTKIAGQYMSDQTAGNLSTVFDIGGVAGGVLAGYISDKLKARAITAATFMYVAIPALFVFHQFGSSSMVASIGLMLLVGVLVNGPYALITTAVSADLGTHHSLKGDTRALATVTAIIDGCGSVGAALGPLLTGYISQTGWQNVFNMLMVSALIAGLLLSRQVAIEASEKFKSLSFRTRGDSSGDLRQPLVDKI